MIGLDLGAKVEDSLGLQNNAVSRPFGFLDVEVLDMFFGSIPEDDHSPPAAALLLPGDDYPPSPATWTGFGLGV